MGVAIAVAVVLSIGPYYESVLDPDGATPRTRRQAAYRAAARWLSNSHPVPLGESGNPLSGVLCPWTFGHEFRYYSGWPTVVDGFGPYVSPENTQLAGRYFRSVDEDDAVGLLESLSVRYVVTDIARVSQRPKSKRSLRNRLGLLNGSGREARIGADEERIWIPALTRHRLVYEAPHSGDGVWVYEIVRGAEIHGIAAPGSTVEIELDLRSASGRSLHWVSRDRADASGAFRMRVPYATTDSASSGVATVGSYRLHTRHAQTTFEVHESAIRDGAMIAAPL